MKHGELSNRPAPTMAFNVRCFLQKPERSGGLLSFLTAPTPTVDTRNLSFYASFWARHDFTFYLFALPPWGEDEVVELLEKFEIPHNKVFFPEDTLELRTILANCHAMYYVDTDPGTISVVTAGRVRGIHIDEARVAF